MDIRDDFGFGQAEDVAVALEVFVMVLKALAPEVGLGQLEPLQGGAHGAVDNDDALLQKSFKGMDGGRCHGRDKHINASGCVNG